LQCYLEFRRIYLTDLKTEIFLSLGLVKEEQKLAVKLRLKRTGSKNNACWRIIAADSRAPRDGRHIEEIGYYNPTQDPEELSLKMDRIDYWLSVGAQASEQVMSLIKKAKKQQA
jgi:small subunit ribosomal protein S16